MVTRLFGFMDLLGWGSETKLNWLRTAGSNLFSEHPGAREALRFFRAGGGTIRTTDFLKVRRQVLSIPKWSEQISRLRPTTPVPAAWISTDHGLKLKADEIYYRQEYTGINRLTGEEETGWITVLRPSQLTGPQVQADVEDIMASDPDFYPIDIAEFGPMFALAPEDYFA